MSTNIEELTRQLALARKGLEGLTRSEIGAPTSRMYARAVLRALDDPNIEPCPTCGSIFVQRNNEAEEKYRFWCGECEARKRAVEHKEWVARYDQRVSEQDWAIEQLKECWTNLERWPDVVATFRRFKSVAGVERRLNDFFWLPDRDNSRLADVIYRGVQDKWVPPVSVEPKS